MQLERALTNAWGIRIDDVTEGRVVEVAVHRRRPKKLGVMIASERKGEQV